MELRKLIDQCKHEDILVDEPNKRVIFYQYDENHLEKHLKEIESLEKVHNIEKVSVYGTEGKIAMLEEMDLTLEGKIDGFFNGEDAYIYSQFINPERSISPLREKQEAIIQSAQNKYEGEMTFQLPEGFELRNAEKGDVMEMARVYAEVFQSYPTPMNEPAYIKKVIDQETLFSLVTYDDQIVSIASADINPKYNNAEITDCATLPHYRGKGLLSYIINHLEKRLNKKQVPNLFSLTRAKSAGMNHVIAKHDYEYRGTLVQNCHISGGFEDMNIWVKNLS
ncbi:putative beta-lysine N-acetyltransferase [Alkaliphilus crotonatoxidans]